MPLRETQGEEGLRRCSASTLIVRLTKQVLMSILKMSWFSICEDEGLDHGTT